VNASRVFYAIADMESGSERKAKDGKVTKKNREIHRIKQRHPKVACFYYYLSLSNQSPLSISFNPSTGR